jgi:hypothetical protein
MNITCMSLMFFGTTVRIGRESEVKPNAVSIK